MTELVVPVSVSNEPFPSSIPLVLDDGAVRIRSTRSRRKVTVLFTFTEVWDSVSAAIGRRFVPDEA